MKLTIRFVWYKAWAALSDILLAVYPVVFFWSLKISNKIKIGLCLLMAGGLMYALVPPSTL